MADVPATDASVADVAVALPGRDHTGAFFGTVLARFGAVGLGALTGVVLARALEPAGRGEYAVVVAVASTAVSLGHLSLEQANVYLWHRGEDRSVLARNALLLGLGGGVVVATVAWLIVGALPGSPVLRVDDVALGLVLLAVPFNLAALYLNNLTVLSGRIGRVNMAMLAAAAVQASGALAFVAAGDLDVRVASALWAVASALPLAVVVRGLGIAAARASRALVGRALRTGLQYHLGMAALFLLWRVDVFLLNGMSTTTQVGLYAVAVAVAELLYVFTNSTAEVALPDQMGGEDPAVATLTARVFRVNAVVALAVGVTVVGLAPVVVPLVFGDDFGGSVGPLVALMPGVVALGMIRPVTAFLVRLNRPLVVSALVWSAFTTNVVLNLLFIPRWDAVGAAAASSVAYALLAAAYLRWFLRRGGLALSDLRPRWREVSELSGRLLRRGRA